MKIIECWIIEFLIVMYCIFILSTIFPCCAGVIFKKILAKSNRLNCHVKYSQLKPQIWLRLFVNKISGLKAQFDPWQMPKLSIIDITLTERQKLMDDCLSTFLRFFRLPVWGCDPMTEDNQFNWSSETLYPPVSDPYPMCSWAIVLPTRPQF